MEKRRIPEWAVGMEMVVPGLFVAGDGAMHFDEGMMCEHAGVPVNEHNALMLREAFIEIFTKEFPGVCVTIVGK